MRRVTEQSVLTLGFEIGFQTQRIVEESGKDNSYYLNLMDRPIWDPKYEPSGA